MKKVALITVFILIFVMPQIVSADTSQSDVSTSTSYVSSGRVNYQTLGTGLSGTLSNLDISYFRDTTYYGARVTPYIEECSFDTYDGCMVVASPVQEQPYTGTSGIQSIDMTNYSFNHCKYYRLGLIGHGPFGSMGALRYHGSDVDSYVYGAYGDDIVDDLYFVLHGVDHLDRSANTPENLCVDPVIIAPGLLGSFEVAGTWIMDPILRVYDDLIATLEANGYVRETTLFTFPYDWRNSNVDTAILLKQKINAVKAVCNCSKIDIVAHSMGGLVTQQYVQSDDYEYDIDQVVFLATPHLGSPKAYLAWEGGLAPLTKEDILVQRILKQQGKHLGFGNVYEYIKNYPITSLRELLPVSSYKFTAGDLSTNTLEIYPNNYPTNPFIEALQTNVGRISRVRYSNFVSSSSDSIGGIITNPSDDELWEHGEPIDLSLGSGLVTVEGDETVPITSASALGNNTYYDSSHTKIVSTVSGDLFISLSGRSASSVVTGLSRVDVPFLILQLFSPANLLVVAPDGRKVGYTSTGMINEITGAFYTGADTENEFIVIPNPLDGEYKIETVGTGDGEYTVAVSSISNNLVTDAEYVGTTMVGDISKLVLHVDTSSPSPGLAIAPESSPEPVAVTTTETVPVSRSGGGGGRRAIQQYIPPVATSTNLVGVNPDTFMITMDIPLERFVVLVTNQPSEYVDMSPKVIVQKPQATKGTNPTQTASVINAIEGNSSKSGFFGKIKESFKKLFTGLLSY